MRVGHIFAEWVHPENKYPFISFLFAKKKKSDNLAYLKKIT